MKIYNIPIPSNAEIYIEQFTKIVEFQFMSPEPMVQIFLPEWKMADLTSNLFVQKMQSYLFIGALTISITFLTLLFGGIFGLCSQCCR